MSNDYGVSYSTIRYFEDFVSGLGGVAGFQRTQDILFGVQKTDGQTKNILLANEYLAGEEFVLRVLRDFKGVHFICIGGNWNKIAGSATKYCEEAHLGIGNFRDVPRFLENL